MMRKMKSYLFIIEEYDEKKDDQFLRKSYLLIREKMKSYLLIREEREDKDNDDDI